MPRRKSPASPGRPSRRGKSRTHRTGARDALWTVGPHVDRVRGRRRKRPAQPLAVIPSDRWRPMKRVAGVPWRGDERRREERAAHERFPEQESPRHGRKRRLLEFEDEQAAGSE